MAKKDKTYTLAQLAKLAEQHALKKAKGTAREDLGRVYMQTNLVGDIEIFASDGHKGVLYTLDTAAVVANNVKPEPEGMYFWTGEHWEGVTERYMSDTAHMVRKVIRLAIEDENNASDFGIDATYLAAVKKTCHLYKDDTTKVSPKGPDKAVVFEREALTGEISATLIIMPRRLSGQVDKAAYRWAKSKKGRAA